MAVLFDQVVHDVAVHVGQAEVAALIGEGELPVVYAHEVEDGALPSP